MRRPPGADAREGERPARLLSLSADRETCARDRACYAPTSSPFPASAALAACTAERLPMYSGVR